jgi:glucose-6-phosphate dehydrogenase assembly protein OpcA
VTLHVQGAALEHVRGIVEPLLIPDVRTHLWWTGTPPLGDPVIADTLDLCETLVIDSARFERPHESLLALARLADEKGRDVGIADFQWARASAWRALLAQFFEPAERRQFLDGIDAVGIDYAGVGRGNPVAAALFAGWLASALHWKLQRAAGGAGDAVTVYLEGPDGHSVEIGFGSVAAAGRAEGEIVALSVEAGANRQTARFEIARAGDGDAAEMRAQVGEGREIRQRLPLGMTEDAELLVGLLVQGRMDEVYQRALRAAVQLLESAR